MKAHDGIVLFVFGLGFWLVGTVYYAWRGRTVLETTSLQYWINFMLAPILSAAICVMVLRLRGVPGTAWAPAMLLIALPGMFGEALILSRFATFMPRLHPSSGGRYAAFLFAAYGLVLTIGEVITLSANR